MKNIGYKTEQNILNLKKYLKEVINRREVVVNNIGIDEYNKLTDSAQNIINDMTDSLLANTLLN
tara:strand:- start:1137 stop:1328 length:192 start_codon:yes stop_codon:yes gene_type:complete